jgi:uncharacterized membrane-anchored protein
VPDLEFEPAAAKPEPGTALDHVVGRIRRNERGVLAAAAAFQLLVLIAMIAGATIPWTGSQTVLLRVVPVDPRDLMRGDYVTLSYEISRILPEWANNLPADAKTWEGQTVYVVLTPEEDGRHFHGTAVTAERPASGRFIRGELRPQGRIVFGIESYYVEEGKGKAYEEALLDRRLSAEVALTSDGRPMLRRLVFD